MEWLRGNERTWRAAVLVLLLVALIGPWAFGDRVNVPAEEDCTPPWMRVRGDFCAERASGLRLFANLGEGLQFLRQAASLASVLIMVLYYLVPFLLPLLSSLLLLLFGGRRLLVGFHLLAVVLGVGYILFIVAAIGLPLSLRIWGLWLYVFTALGSLALEIGLLAGKRRRLVTA
jgi:hypothetical protein